MECQESEAAERMPAHSSRTSPPEMDRSGWQPRSIHSEDGRLRRSCHMPTTGDESRGQPEERSSTRPAGRGWKVFVD